METVACSLANLRSNELPIKLLLVILSVIMQLHFRELCLVSNRVIAVVLAELPTSSLLYLPATVIAKDSSVSTVHGSKIMPLLLKKNKTTTWSLKVVYNCDKLFYLHHYYINTH